jgi:hypothetical protein
MEISFKRAGFTWKVVHFPVTDNETMSQTGVTQKVLQQKYPNKSALTLPAHHLCLNELFDSKICCHPSFPPLLFLHRTEVYISMTALSLQTFMDDANQHVERLGAFYTHHILPYLTRRSKATYVAAAVAAFISYQVYRMQHIPKNLRHIPAVPFWTYMRSALSKQGIDERARNIILPVVHKSTNGLYLRPNRFGWCVSVAGPGPMKTLFMRKGTVYWKH